MFVAHKAQINIFRDEPEHLDVGAAKVRVATRNEEIAYKALLQHFSAKKPKKAAATKLAKLHEFDTRLEAIQPFIEVWDEYRKRGGKEHDWQPKTAGQITLIENIIDLVTAEDLDLRIFIGCCFKHLAWAGKTPGFTQIINHGLDYYDAHYDDVVSELEVDEYMESASEY